MATRSERSQIELRALLDEERPIRGALLVLTGTGQDELARASAMAAMLAERCLLVAVDGGLQSCSAAGRRPDLWVCDGDSVTTPLDDVASIHYDRNKDFSDLSGALRELSRRRVRVVVVAGMIGGRLDHEWGNLFELGRWSRRFAGLVAPTGRGTVLVTSHGCRLSTVPKRTVSMFCLSATAVVTLRGTRWELSNRRIRPGSLGLSNESGTELDLQVDAGTVALVCGAADVAEAFMVD